MISDLTFLTEFTKGDKIKMKKYIEMYLITGQQKVNEIRESFQHKEYETLKVAAHTMKSQARYMGISAAEAKIVQIEHACNTLEHLDALDALVPAVCGILETSFAELSEKVKTL